MVGSNHARLRPTDTAKPVERACGRGLMVVGDWCATDRAIYDALGLAKAWKNLLVLDDPAPTLRRFFLAVAAAAGVSIPARMPLIDISSHVNSSLLRVGITGIWWMGGCIKPGSCVATYDHVHDLFDLFMKDHGMSLIVESSAWPVNADVARLFKVDEAGRLAASDIYSILGGTR